MLSEGGWADIGSLSSVAFRTDLVLLTSKRRKDNNNAMMETLEHDHIQSVITVQREFHLRLKEDAPLKNNLTRWYRRFVETRCFCKGRKSRQGNARGGIHSFRDWY
jgi:hypothetical protein